MQSWLLLSLLTPRCYGFGHGFALHRLAHQSALHRRSQTSWDHCSVPSRRSQLLFATAKKQELDSRKLTGRLRDAVPLRLEPSTASVAKFACTTPATSAASL